MDDLKKVSDESRFLMYHVEGQAWMRRLPTEATSEAFLGHFSSLMNGLVLLESFIMS